MNLEFELQRIMDEFMKEFNVCAIGLVICYTMMASHYLLDAIGISASLHEHAIAIELAR